MENVIREKIVLQSGRNGLMNPCCKIVHTYVFNAKTVYLH